MKKYSTHIVWVVIAIAALAGGYFWGKSATGANGFGGKGGTFALGGSSTRGTFAGRGGAGGGLVAGQILSLSGDSMTVQLPNGNSEVVFYSSSTPVVKPEPAPVSSLAEGTEVMIVGSANSDGSLTAQSIQVRNGSSTVGFGPDGGGGTGAAGG